MRAKLTSTILLLFVCTFGFTQVRPPSEGWNFQTLQNGDWKTKPTEVASGLWFRVEIRSQDRDTYVDVVDIFGVATPRQTLIPNLEHECELVEIAEPAYSESMPFVISGQDGSAGELIHETMLMARTVAPGNTLVKLVRVRIKDTQSPYSTKHDNPIEFSGYVAIKG